MTPEQDLLDTIEEIRKNQFPDIPAALVKQIALIERDYADNRQEAYKRITQAIDTQMSAKAGG